jgi:hypothetical protein
MLKLTAFFCLAFFTIQLSAQDFIQNIKGQVLDAQSGAPIPGVMVQLLQGDSTNVTVTDLEGYYKLFEVPVGRTAVLFQFISFETVVRQNLIVTSGKELILDVKMEESITDLVEVTIQNNKNASEANNENVVVSNVKLNPQQTQKFAGTFQDVSRTAANYAGVVPAGDQRNDIIVRGNSPIGVIWRLDGVNIPNPNHFGTLGTTGGPVSMLNNNNLAASDFLTGAFPAEYGNGIAGAFDLKMRKGNNEKHEFMGQFGFNGLELGAEGPFSKNSKASYMVNYRYSTLGIFDALGVSFGVPAIPQYQDVAFKVDLPTNGKRGRFQLFGLGGISHIDLLDSKRDPEEWSFTDSGTDVYFKSNMGVIGLNHKIFLNSNTYWSNTISTTHTENKIASDSLAEVTLTPARTYNNNSSEGKISLNSTINTKFNAKSSWRNGVIVDLMNTAYKEEFLSNETNRWLALTDFTGSSVLLQAFSQWRYKFSDKFILNTGAHYQLFTLNNSDIIEPRIGMRYKITKKQSINLASGLHSQIQPLRVYLLETRHDNGTTSKTNENLDFTKSLHVVLGYKANLFKNVNFKIETYYQNLYSVPVELNSYYSMSNIGADFVSSGVDSLLNNGTGENYGVEVTLEKMFSKGFYYLLNVSLYNSTYKGGDGVSRNTAFNGQYTSNALAGYEIKINQKLTIDINAKVSYAGGKRYPKIDIASSIENGNVTYDQSSLYELKYKDYFRADLKIGVRLNGKKITQEWAFDVQNVSNQKNIFREVFDVGSQTIKQEYQIGFFPVGLYKITF